jgi:signal transduction histidine kinase
MFRIRKWLPPSWLIAGFTIVMVGMLALSVKRVLRVEEDLRRTTAVENAARYSEALQAFRTVYTSEVVNRAQALGVPASHDYLTNPNTIPLPATMTKVLGERLARSQDVLVQLYSDYPFPWRPPASSLDDFQRAALVGLRAEPDGRVVRFESNEKGDVVRYAVADRLRSDCVACHNEHPDSPKRDWVEGDVRGVLEVAHTVGIASTELEADLRSTVEGLFWMGLLALGILALTALWQRQVADTSQRMADEAERTKVRIQAEMSARQDAEEARLQAEAQVRHAQKLESLGVMAAGIAHDFNNLLVSILGNTQLVMEGMDASQRAHQQLALVERAGIKAADLIRQLLAYAGDSPFDPQPVRLNECINQLSPLLMAAAGRSAKLTMELEEDLPPILAEFTQIEQILLNLITNASEAMGTGGGEITVRTGLLDAETMMEDDAWSGEVPGEGQHIYVEVEDTGSGLDDETRVRMFDPFYSTKGPGRGLGLATLMGIIHAHNGSVLVATGVGGTSMRLTFPVTRATEPIEAQLRPQTQQRGVGWRILVIDDQASARETTAAMLWSRGFTVSTAVDGRDGLDQLKQDPDAFDAVLLDMSMPGLNGLETYRLIRANHLNLPVVFFSGLTAMPEVHALVRACEARFLRKPFTVDQLVTTLIDDR